MIYAVIDTNVIVSAMMAKHVDSATVKVLNAIRNGRIRPTSTRCRTTNSCRRWRCALRPLPPRVGGREEGKVRISVICNSRLQWRRIFGILFAPFWKSKEKNIHADNKSADSQGASAACKALEISCAEGVPAAPGSVSRREDDDA